MKKLLIGLLMFGMVISAFALNYQELPPSNPLAGSGTRYSPKNFTATLFSPITQEAMPSNKIILSGGNTAGYTTAECARVIAFKSTGPAAVYDPTMYRFNYNYPTLEVVGINFNPKDSFRVEFIDTAVGTKSNKINLDMPTAGTIYTLTLTLDAGALISYDLIARGGDIKWLESNSATADYKTIKQDICDYPNLPVFIADDTKWYFTSATSNVSIEAQIWE